MYNYETNMMQIGAVMGQIESLIWDEMNGIRVVR
jgi:hypothetical protein